MAAGVGACGNFSPAGNGAGAATTFFAGVGLGLGFGDEGEPDGFGFGVPVGLGRLLAFGEADGAVEGEGEAHADPVWAGARGAPNVTTHNQLIATAASRTNLGDGSTLGPGERRGIEDLSLRFLPGNQYRAIIDRIGSITFGRETMFSL